MNDSLYCVKLAYSIMRTASVIIRFQHYEGSNFQLHISLADG